MCVIILLCMFSIACMPEYDESIKFKLFAAPAASFDNQKYTSEIVFVVVMNVFYL